MKIVIIGAGSVGTNLYHAFELKSVRTELVHGRPLTAKSPTGEANLTAAGDPTAQRSYSAAVCLPEADVYIYAIADHALREVIARVYAPKALHLHTSGTMPKEVFGDDKPHAGVLYFFQSFSREVLIDDWSGIPCFIEGKNIDDVAAIYSLAQTLTSRIYEASQHDRERLHIAGVFANNYSNLMYRMAKEILKDTQIPFEALLPLIDQTAAKVHSITPRDAQTGPAKRGDKAVIAHQIEVLRQLRITNGELRIGDHSDSFSGEELSEVYQALAGLILKAHNH